MGDHMVLCVDRLITPESLQSLQGTTAPGSSLESSSSKNSEPPVCAIAVEDVDEHDGSEEDPLIQTVECRICQEEDSIKNLEIPCACSGSLKVPFANFYCLGSCSSTKWLFSQDSRDKLIIRRVYFANVAYVSALWVYGYTHYEVVNP